ncbi:gamma subclass chorismate mutase AroQ [Pseudoalteromonas denitrificans]|uniref:chorismate mutase n=1 Tax=Pseudoalteromonas denitrificans DSM 6059 TaxID=1123010 RepID=A0A1I1UQS6_9GAMM|nr:gamma subclass chorismate mutase AroQ [Pseudoalteromonas denitrificans]SFD73182.1 chorismate mutase [Pseudoalteromonas denitrificans DSM 6059]
MRLFLTICVLWANLAQASDLSLLFNDLNSRLTYMPDVAHYKALNQLPIEDLIREQKVTKSAAKTAKQFGLDITSALAFNQAQMNIAKVIQYRYRARLLTEKNSKMPRDLITQVRPALIALGKSINQNLSTYLKHNGQITEQNWQQFKDSVNHKYLTEQDLRYLFEVLKKIKIK